MKRSEALQVVALLNAAFPRDALEGPSLELFASEIETLENPEWAAAAARKIVRSKDRFPSVREIREVYAAERKASRPELHVYNDPMWEKRPALPPAAAQYLERIQTERAMDDPVPIPSGWPPAEPGKCADCEHDGDRVMYGDACRELCRACATSRARVSARNRPAAA